VARKLAPYGVRVATATGGPERSLRTQRDMLVCVQAVAPLLPRLPGSTTEVSFFCLHPPPRSRRKACRCWSAPLDGRQPSSTLIALISQRRRQSCLTRSDGAMEMLWREGGCGVWWDGSKRNEAPCAVSSLVCSLSPPLAFFLQWVALLAFG